MKIDSLFLSNSQDAAISIFPGLVLFVCNGDVMQRRKESTIGLSSEFDSTSCTSCHSGMIRQEHENTNWCPHDALRLSVLDFLARLRVLHFFEQSSFSRAGDCGMEFAVCLHVQHWSSLSPWSSSLFFVDVAFYHHCQHPAHKYTFLSHLSVHQFSCAMLRNLRVCPWILLPPVCEHKDWNGCMRDSHHRNRMYHFCIAL